MYVSIHVYCACTVGVLCKKIKNMFINYTLFFRFYKLYSLYNYWNLVDGVVGNFSISPTQPYYKGAKEGRARRGKSLVFNIYPQSSKLDKDEVSLSSDSESEYGFL